MEERIIDKDALRGVKVKKREGEQDVVDALAPEAETPDEAENAAYVLDFPEGEEDDELVGLTPTQLQEVLERRRRAEREAREQCDALCASADAALAAGTFREAETLYLQAIACIAEDERAQIGLWQARTHNYTSPDVLYDGDMAAEFARALPAARGGVLQAFGEALAKERGALSAEADPLRRKVEAAQEARRGPFAANRAYYRVRAVVALALVVLFAVGAAVSAAYILRTRSVAPIVLTASFGALALAELTALCVFAHKWYVAAGLCRENERLASTPEGERLAALEERLACLGLALGEETFRPTEHGAEEAPAPQADAPRQ